MGEGPIRVLLAEDEPKLLFAVQTLLDLEPTLEVVSVVSSGEAAVDAARDLEPDVVLLDVRLGASDGIESALSIRESFPQIGVVIYTGDDGELDRARKAGFEHVLLKGAVANDLVAAIEAAGAQAA